MYTFHIQRPNNLTLLTSVISSYPHISTLSCDCLVPLITALNHLEFLKIQLVKGLKIPKIIKGTGTVVSYLILFSNTNVTP